MRYGQDLVTNKMVIPERIRNVREKLKLNEFVDAQSGSPLFQCAGLLSCSAHNILEQDTKNALAGRLVMLAEPNGGQTLVFLTGEEAHQ